MTSVPHKHASYSGRPDRIGFWVSSLCLVHCALPPILFAASSTWEAPAGWEMLDWLFLAVSFVAVWYASRSAQSTFITILLWVGWLALVSGILLEHLEWFSAEYFLYSGSIILLVTHFWNLRVHKRTKSHSFSDPNFIPMESKRA